MVESKAWDWGTLKGNKGDNVWLNPCIESYYLVNRWLSQGKKDFLDLGCGLGRHSVQFAKAGFKTHAFDLSEVAVQSCREWAEKEKLEIDVKAGDMLDLSYEDESMDCVLCKNVISHTDTLGMKKVASEIYRVLRSSGECYLTLGSKETWGYKQDWPVVDENTKIRVEDGPENGVPHFYADRDLIFEIFSDFEIVSLSHMEDDVLYHPGSWHYDVLIRKK